MRWYLRNVGLSEYPRPSCASCCTVSPGFSLSAVAVFARNARSGFLTQLGCLSEGGVGGCGVARALAGAASVAVSPNGKNAYVASGAALAVFTRE